MDAPAPPLRVTRPVEPSAIICAMRKALAYFGLDGSATRMDWLHAAVEVLPPFVVAALVGHLDGVDGVLGWGLQMVYLAVAWIAWSQLVLLFAPWKRA